MISDSILQTLGYSDHFSFPLTLSEIHARLIQASCSKSQLTKLLSSLVTQKKVEQLGGYYYLPGRSNLIARRKQNLQTSRPVFSKARVLATKLGQVPSILAIYLTGSLAMSNSSSDSDIDFMIITQNDRLWTTRLLLTIYTTLIGLRRTPGSKQNTGKLCLNLYLTPKSFLLPATKQSLYTAYELIQAIPLYDPTNTHSKLLSTNSWIHNYLPNFSLPKGKEFRTLSKTSVRNFWDHIESFLYNLQLLYMKNKITREYITRDSAFFHPHNPAPRV